MVSRTDWMLILESSMTAVNDKLTALDEYRTSAT